MHARLGEPIACQFKHWGPLRTSHAGIHSSDNTSAYRERVANQVYRCHRFGLGTSPLPAGRIELVCTLIKEDL